MNAQSIPLGELGERDLAAWRELAAGAIEPNPFFDPDFVLAAARGLGEINDVAILRVADSEGWAACLPIRHYSRWHRLPLPGMATWLHIYCLLGTPLLRPDGAADSVEAILAQMGRGGPRSAFASLEWIPGEGPIADAVEKASATGVVAFDRFERAVLYRRPQNDYLDGQVKGKHRREHRRLAKLLAEELDGPLELVDRAGERKAVETFLELEASGWKGQQGTALTADPRHAEFFRETAGAFAARGALELLFLEAGGQVVAARCNLLGGGISFCFKVAYDERFQRFAPGRELELHLIDRFHEDSRLKSMDSCADPNNQLIGRLWADRRPLATTLHPAPGPLGALARPAARMAVALRERRRARSTA
ncbi:MAG TPA: GNAT family N-acetyltransferase [Solirubrobacterales bacterium]